ncbi:glycoside hydrolase family 43 protein [Ceratobasidium sp. AG-Ba]|nr:glycoside hydrolase family 43 protein [Ceratobasidium sp. AG-Ba]
MLWLSSGLLLASLQLVSATLQIVPGATWTASGTNQHVQAHGGGIIKVGSTYYWIGENKLNGGSYQSVNCYSSTNLVEWKYVGALLGLQGSGDLGPNRVVERPKVIYNDSTKQYVMYMHIDSSNYGEAKRANGLRINKLSSDYLSVVSNVYTWSQKYEAPAVFKSNGVYFMLASQLTGWDTNDNMYSTSTSLSGPWSSWKTFAPAGTRTYDSQTTFVLQVGNNFMYMGDRWFSNNLMRSSYIWLPLSVSGTTLSLPNNYVNWVMDANSGSMTAGRAAVVASCSGCSGGFAVGYLGGSGNGVLTFNNVGSNASTRTTLRIKHENGDTAQRYGTITVNGVSQTVAFLPTADGQTPGSRDGYVADIDRLMVPVS